MYKNLALISKNVALICTAINANPNLNPDPNTNRDPNPIANPNPKLHPVLQIRAISTHKGLTDVSSCILSGARQVWWP